MVLRLNSYTKQFPLLFLLFLCIYLSVPAQVTHGLTPGSHPDWGGINYIAGTVFWPSGQPVNIRLPIILRSPTKGDFFTNTTTEGQFIIGGVPQGEYWIVIDREKDFEPVTYYVQVTPPVPGTFSGQNKPAYHVLIRLRDKVVSGPKPGVVKIADVGVPKQAMDLYSKAVELSSRLEHKSAIEQLKLAVGVYPAFLNAYNEMGVQYMRLNELEKADEALLAALKIKADAFEPLLNRGIVLFRLKRFVDAQVLLQSAIGIKDRSAQAHFYLGRTLFALQRYDEAEKALDLAINIAGDEMKEAHRILAMMFIEKDDRPRALTALETYLRLMPNAPDAEQLKDALVQLRASIRPPEPPAKPLM